MALFGVARAAAAGPCLAKPSHHASPAPQVVIGIGHSRRHIGEMPARIENYRSMISSTGRSWLAAWTDDAPPPVPTVVRLQRLFRWHWPPAPRQKGVVREQPFPALWRLEFPEKHVDPIMCKVDRDHGGGTDTDERFMPPLRIGVPEQIADIGDDDQRPNRDQARERRARSAAGMHGEEDEILQAMRHRPARNSNQRIGGQE